MTNLYRTNAESSDPHLGLVLSPLCFVQIYLAVFYLNTILNSYFEVLFAASIYNTQFLSVNLAVLKSFSSLVILIDLLEFSMYTAMSAVSREKLDFFP